jgi:hypothetical protein
MDPPVHAKEQASVLVSRREDESMTRSMQSPITLLCMGILLASLTQAGVTTAIEVGDTAPDFSLPSTIGGEISLSQFRGKKLVLLEFYGADFSPV